MTEMAVLEEVLDTTATQIDWNDFDSFRPYLEQQVLPDYLPTCRWYRSKSMRISQINCDLIPWQTANASTKSFYPLRIKVTYLTGKQESYFLPVFLVSGEMAKYEFKANFSKAILAEVIVEGASVYIADAIYDASFRAELFQYLKAAQSFKAKEETLDFERGILLAEAKIIDVQSKVLNVEQSNTAIIYNNQFFLKLFRKLEPGINPDLEFLRFFSQHSDFKNAPLYGGSIQLHKNNQAAPTILGLLQNKIENKGDAWSTVLHLLEAYYQRVLDFGVDRKVKLLKKDRLYYMDIPQPMRQLIGRTTCERVVQLAKRTAEMHIALASNDAVEDFAPVQLNTTDQNHILNRQSQLVHTISETLAEKIAEFPTEVAQEAQKVIDLRPNILNALSPFATKAIDATQTRVHGDYHLGQVLDSGTDFYIIDFEGEPMRPIEERREKLPPFKDVAGMVRSFHYAAYGQLYLNRKQYAEQLTTLERWASYWFHYISQLFLTAYLDRTENQSFIPKDKAALELLLRTFIVEKAIYEVDYEMNNRPNWLRIPLRGVLSEMVEKE